jgi:hypothetical protein
MVVKRIIDYLVSVGRSKPATGKKLSRMIIHKLLSDVTKSVQLILVALHNGRFVLIQYRNYVPQGIIHIKSLPAAGYSGIFTLKNLLTFAESTPLKKSYM